MAISDMDGAEILQKVSTGTISHFLTAPNFLAITIVLLLSFIK